MAWRSSKASAWEILALDGRLLLVKLTWKSPLAMAWRSSEARGRQSWRMLREPVSGPLAIAWRSSVAFWGWECCN